MSIVDQLGGAIRDGFRPEQRDGALTLAKVTNIKDDKNFCRVKCLPIGAQDSEETDWCYVMTPMGGKECGLCFFPQVNDLVVLAYLGNDPHRPLVLGGFWNSEVKPPYPIKDGKLQDYAIRTPKKIELLFHDEDKKQRVTLTMPSGAVITVDDGDSKVEIKDKSGDNALNMDLKKGEIALKAKTKLTLSAGSTAITLESNGKITEKGSGAFSMEGANVQVKASGKLAMQGATAEVKSSATLDLKASGPASLKGAIVKIN